jgi:hypothetical protein
LGSFSLYYSLISRLCLYQISYALKIKVIYKSISYLNIHNLFRLKFNSKKHKPGGTGYVWYVS